MTVNTDTDPNDPDSAPTFDLSVVKDGKEVESFEGLTVTPKADNNAATKTADVGVHHGHGRRRPRRSRRSVDGDAEAGQLPGEGRSRRRRSQVKAPAFIGSETARRGINGLALAENVTIVIVPDLITAATQGRTARSTTACGRPCRRR